jgi:amino acid transporter
VLRIASFLLRTGITGKNRWIGDLEMIVQDKAASASSPPMSLGSSGNLKSNVLGYWEILAQSIALISPTMTAALIVPVMYSTAGSSSWLAYAFGAVMLLFVALCLNEFAKRQTTSGSMYAYVTRGMGPVAGGIAGWSLIFAYLFIGIAGMTGFTNFVQVIASMMGVSSGVVNSTIFPIISSAICMAISFYCAYKDVQLSAVIMLILEVASVALILVLSFIVLFHHGFPVDTDQIQLKGFSPSTLGFGVVIAIFSLVGFEVATAFGNEAKKPLVNIPKAVIWSLILTGLFFVFVTYMEVYGTKGSSNQLGSLTAPLNTLSTMYHVGWMAIPISIGAIVSFFSLNLSCLNSAARVMFKMGSHSALHQAVSFSHHKNETPHIAIMVTTALMMAIVTGMLIWHNVDADVFGYVGSFGAFGFLGAYFMVSFAAPMYLKQIGELKASHIIIAAIAVMLLIVPAVGSVYSVPPIPAPVKYFVWIYLAYMCIGLISGLMQKSRKDQVMESVKMDLDSSTAS